jgi:hypothetical protein
LTKLAHKLLSDLAKADASLAVQMRDLGIPPDGDDPKAPEPEPKPDEDVGLRGTGRPPTVTFDEGHEAITCPDLHAI